MRFRLSPRVYSYIWIPAAFVPTLLAGYTCYRLDKDRSGSGLIIFLLFVLSIGLRFWQFLSAWVGWYFTAEIYDLWRILFLVLLSLTTILYVLLSTTSGLPCSQWIGLTILSNIVIWLVERYAVGCIEFQQYMLGKKVIECLRQIAVRDSIGFHDFYAAWARILSPFFLFFKALRVSWSRSIRVILRVTGPIALLDDDDDDNNEEEDNTAALDLEPGTSSSASGSGSTSRARARISPDLPAQFSSNLTHWSLLGPEWHSAKALWVTADSPRVRDRIVHTALEHFRMGSRISSASTSDDSPEIQTTTAEVHVVDVSGAHSVVWPLIHGLALVSAAYRNEIAKNPPKILSETYGLYRFSGCFDVTAWNPKPGYYYDEGEGGAKKVIRDFFIRPLQSVEKESNKRRKAKSKKRKRATILNDVDLELGAAGLEENYLEATGMHMPRALLIIHGLRDEHAEELYALIEAIQHKLDSNVTRSLGFVIVSTPALLRRVAEKHERVLDRVCTMYVPHLGDSPLIYSGIEPSPPMLYENIFHLLVEGVHRLGGADAERIWSRVLQLSNESAAWRLQMEESLPLLSTQSIFAKVFRALKDRKEIIECLAKMPQNTRSQKSKKMQADDIKIASVLQELFVMNTYRNELADVPEEHAAAVLNLTHILLDGGGLPQIPNWNQFSRRAHRLLNTLATSLDAFPEELSISADVLLSQHPVKTGGFGDVYRGRYTDSDGKQHEIALKVLRIFDSGQTKEQRRVLYAKFTKEALMWHYLKHPNVVPFLGVDSTTFPSPRRAMVSPWMAQGSVLKYVSDPENSPVGPYAIDLICDIIEGLKFLHSLNVIHGDLCGRNILINDDGEACLADFGLTGFIESDTTNKDAAAQRAGCRRNCFVRRRQKVISNGQPRRISGLLDASAIWTEGTVEPFSHFVQDIGIVLAFSKHAHAEKDAAPNAAEQPYRECPADQAGNVMPDRLWALFQWCWKFDAAGRPSADLIADKLGEMNVRKRRNQTKVNGGGAGGASRSDSVDARARVASPTSATDDDNNDAHWATAAPSGADSSDEELISLISSTSRAKGKQRAQPMIPLPSISRSRRGTHILENDAEPPPSSESPITDPADTIIVRFGALPEDDTALTFDAGHEDVDFLSIFEGLTERLCRHGALAEPLAVYCNRVDSAYLDLRFKTAMEANNFAMTWTVHRFAPYLECEAFIVDAE